MDSMTSNLNDNNKVVSLQKANDGIGYEPISTETTIANTFKLVVSNEPRKISRFCGRGSSRNLLLDQSKLMPITARLQPPPVATTQYFLVNVRPIRDNKFRF